VADTDTAAHTDDMGYSSVEPGVIILMGRTKSGRATIGRRDQLPHVKDHTFALVRRGV
jgi:hypothetical protein